MVKRYVEEPGTDTVREAMDTAEAWFIVRTGFVETIRAVGIVAGGPATRAVRDEWGAFGIVEVDQSVVESAADLVLSRDLRSLGALHLAAALTLPPDDLVLATWDRRLHVAAHEEGLSVIPQRVR